ncbi:MAG: hypothetical protein AAFR66_20530 [Bacteroidota bacterium]
MKKSALTASQLAHLNVFSLILECDGWADPLAIERRFDGGEELSPEGMRVFESNQRVLEAQFHAPVNMITLSISTPDKEEKIVLFFLYASKPEKILEWMVSVKNSINTVNYSKYLEEINDYCTTIMEAVSTPASCELKPVVIK